MTTRQNIPIDERNPSDHLDSGYEGGIPEDYTIPPCGLEDVDKAVVNLFDKEIGFQKRSVGASNGAVEVKKPFVVFATGERFALTKRLRPLRDKNGALVLPTIAIRRTGTEQTSDDLIGRGMNQSTGNLIIKKRLDHSDRDYQSFLNKLALQHSDLPDTRKETGSYGPRSNLGTLQGGLLEPHLGNNVWEIISIPQPQFWTQTYEITFWTNYTEHMNYLVETLFSSFLPQGKMFKLTTEKGYWFIGYVDDQLQSGDNFDDFTEQDRLIRYTFTMKVKSFLLVANGPGNKVPIRRYLSSPTITFDLVEAQGEVFDEKQLPESVRNSGFILTDIEQDGETAQDNTSIQKVLVSKEVIDPRTGKKEVKTVRILESNQKSGETVYYAPKAISLEDFVSLLK
jgi:hypothetical protein